MDRCGGALRLSTLVPATKARLGFIAQLVRSAPEVLLAVISLAFFERDDSQHFALRIVLPPYVNILLLGVAGALQRKNSGAPTVTAQDWDVQAQ
jgi:hypothetical protein